MVPTGGLLSAWARRGAAPETGGSCQAAPHCRSDCHLLTSGGRPPAEEWAQGNPAAHGRGRPRVRARAVPLRPGGEVPVAATGRAAPSPEGTRASQTAGSLARGRPRTQAGVWPAAECAPAVGQGSNLSSNQDHKQTGAAAAAQRPRCDRGLDACLRRRYMYKQPTCAGYT